MRKSDLVVACSTVIALAAGCATGMPGAPPPSPATVAPAERPASTVPEDAVARIAADLVYVAGGTLPSMHLGGATRPEIKVDGFWLGKHEVTQEEWTSIMGSNPSLHAGDPRLPVTNMSWQDAQRFVARLNQAPGGGFRLATAEEWELACRAGAPGHVPMQANESTLDEYAWWGKSSGGRAHSVATLQPNDFGLYDMLGNVAEWCETAEDPTAEDKLHVTAGGNFSDENLVGQDCSTTAWMAEDGSDEWTGLRLAKSGPAPAKAPKGSAKP